MDRTLRLLFAIASTTTACDQPTPASNENTATEDRDHHVLFERRTFVPEPDLTQFLADRRRHGVLQFYEQPQDLAPIRALGIEIHGANHHHSYYVTVPLGLSSAALRQAGARALFSMQPLDRLSSRLVALGEAQPDRSVASAHIAMHFATTVDPNEVRHTLRDLGASSVSMDEARGRATAELPVAALLELAGHEWIWWIDHATGPLTPDIAVATERIGTREVQPPPWGLAPAGSGLTGDGVAVGIWEVATLGAAAVLEEHPDLVGRVTTAPGQNAAPSSHATQVAGVIAGDGTASQVEGGTPSQWAGLAPQTHVVSWDATDAPAEMLMSLAHFRDDHHQPLVRHLHHHRARVRRGRRLCSARRGV